jgi:membrane protease YdiL (CAAX protease family)
MQKRGYVIRCFMVFALAFGLRQATVFFLGNGPYEEGVGSLTSLVIVSMTVLLIKAEGSGFRKHGLHLPKRANRLLAISLFLAVFYVLIVIFVPGGISGFEAIPAAPISWEMLFTGASVLLAAVAAETLFRGYIQISLESAYDFPTALVVVTLMFTLYMLPIRLYFTNDSGEFIRESLPLLAESVFLCFFFREAKTLLCPIVFPATVTLLEEFTPLEPTAKDYITLVSLLSYIFLVVIMEAFMDEIKQQNTRLEPVAVIEPEQP